jgi:hypothetical protein
MNSDQKKKPSKNASKKFKTLHKSQDWMSEDNKIVYCFTQGSDRKPFLREIGSDFS